MILKDITQNKLLTTHLKEAKSLKDKGLGLLLKSNPKFMIFYTRFGIHTFGMKEKIDIVVLDNTNHIVKLKENFKPNRAFFWNLKFSKVLEVPAGTIARHGLKLGDLIQII